MGFSFKPLTDDIREASSLEIIELLKDSGCKVKAYDLAAMKEAKRHFGNTIEYAHDPYEALKNADCVMLVTEWNEFRFPDWKRIKDYSKTQ